MKTSTLKELGLTAILTLIALITWHYKRDFAREFGESLRVKRAAPLGEDEMAKIQMDPDIR